MESTVETLLKRQRILTVIIAVLAFLCVSMFFFGLINQIEAKKHRELVKIKTEELEQCKKESEREKIIAEKNAMEASRQQKRAEEFQKNNSKK